MPICRDFYGSDGTRTRDLRRDRPVMALPGCAGIGGDYRHEKGFSTLVLRGFPGAAGTFRRPPAGSVRDALVVGTVTSGNCIPTHARLVAFKCRPTRDLLSRLQTPVQQGQRKRGNMARTRFIWLVGAA